MRRLLPPLWLMALGALLVLIVITFCALFTREILTVDSGPVTADALVVLGGNQFDRPEHAAELFKAGAAPRVLVTGMGDTDLSVQTLEKNGVPENAIIKETRASSTLENAKFSIPLLQKMGAHRVILVTSWYHSRRAQACFEHFAPDMTFYSRPTYVIEKHMKWGGPITSPIIAAEFIKLTGYWIVYGVFPFSLSEPGTSRS